MTFTCPVSISTTLTPDDPPIYAPLELLQVGISYNTMNVLPSTGTYFGHGVISIPEAKYKLLDNTAFPHQITQNRDIVIHVLID